MSTIMIEYQQYIDAVVNGIIAKFTERQRTNPALKADYDYIEDIVTLHKDPEANEWDLKYPTYISRPINDFYENDESVEAAIEELYPGCLSLYNAHGSLL